MSHGKGIYCSIEGDVYEGNIGMISDMGREN